MKFIFPILAIFVCLGAAYFTLSQSGKFTDVQAARIEATDTNRVVSAKADAADANIKKEEALLDASKDALALATQSASALESNIASLKNDVSKLDSQLAAQESDKEELQKTLEEVEKILANLGGGEVDIDTLPDKITELKASLEDKRTKAEELETLIEGAEKSLVTKRKDVKSIKTRLAARNERIARNAMEARITAVNQDWGFIVIGAGKNSGFTPQTTLLVKRDGRLIGKVNPSAIEPTQTIAEIDLDSLSPGVRIQPGDSVILAKPAAN